MSREVWVVERMIDGAESVPIFPSVREKDAARQLHVLSEEDGPIWAKYRYVPAPDPEPTADTTPVPADDEQRACHEAQNAKPWLKEVLEDASAKADEGLRERLDLVLLSHDADFEAAIKGRRPVPMTLAERLEQFVISEIERAKNGKS